MADSPQYRQALVSFIDILGFRDLVSKATVPEILSVLESKERLTLHWGRNFPTKATDGTTVTFSDLIVNVTFLNQPCPLYSLFDQFVTMGFRQLLLAMAGTFVRGGIALGDIYVSDKMIFGPALIKAYDLERGTAKWPIIAVDPALVGSIDLLSPQHIARLREKEGSDGDILATAFLTHLRSLVKTTKEGTLFLDYLSCAAEVDSTTGDIPYFLKDHKESVLAAHRQYRHWKYQFVAEYHDSYCRKYFDSRADLVIGALA